MSFNYSTLRRSALNLINRFGQSMTYTSKAAAAYSVSTSSVTLTNTDYTVKGVVFDFDTMNTGTQMLDNSLIEAGDRRVYIAASGLNFTPKLEDTLTINSEVWRVVRIINAIDPGGTMLLYDLQIRR